MRRLVLRLESGVLRHDLRPVWRRVLRVGLLHGERAVLRHGMRPGRGNLLRD